MGTFGDYLARKPEEIQPDRFCTADVHAFVLNDRRCHVHVWAGGDLPIISRKAQGSFRTGSEIAVDGGLAQL